jgi:hypothetical protein
MIVDAFENCIDEITAIKKDFGATRKLTAESLQWSERDMQTGMDKIISWDTK